MVGDVDSSLIRKEDAHLLAMYVQYFHTEEQSLKNETFLKLFF